MRNKNESKQFKGFFLLLFLILTTNLFAISVLIQHNIENRYIPIDSDSNYFNYIGSISGKSGYAIFNVNQGTSLETNVSQISENWNPLIPNNAIALNIRFSVFATTLESNYLSIYPYGNNNSVQAIAITTIVSTRRIDTNGIIGIGINNSITLKIEIVNGSAVVFWLSITGYFI